MSRADRPCYCGSGLPANKCWGDLPGKPEYANGGAAPEGSPMPVVNNDCAYRMPKRVTDKDHGRRLVRKISETIDGDG